MIAAKDGPSGGHQDDVLQKMFSHPRQWFADVRFTVQDGECWAHAGVVAMGCPHLHRALTAAVPGDTPPGVRHIDMQVARKGPLNVALRYLYTGEVNTHHESTLECLSTADYLELPSLRSLLEEDFVEGLTLEVCCTTVSLALDLCEEIAQKCIVFMQEAAEELLEIPAALSLSVEVLGLVLPSDRFCVSDEKTLFAFLLNYCAINKPNQDDTFALFSSVRLTRLGANTIAETVEPHNVCSDHQIAEAYKAIALKNTEPPRTKQPLHTHRREKSISIQTKTR